MWLVERAKKGKRAIPSIFTSIFSTSSVRERAREDENNAISLMKWIYIIAVVRGIKDKRSVQKIYKSQWEFSRGFYYWPPTSFFWLFFGCKEQVINSFLFSFVEGSGEKQKIWNWDERNMIMIFSAEEVIRYSKGNKFIVIFSEFMLSYSNQLLIECFIKDDELWFRFEGEILL